MLAEDTFRRPNQAYWGTASDGNVWSGDANSSKVFSVKENSGQLYSTSTPYNAIIGPKIENAEVIFSGSLSNFNDTNLGAVLRWTDTNNWYKAYITGSNLIIQSRVNGSYRTLASKVVSTMVNTSYTMRFQIAGNTLYAKSWASNTPEPTSWTLTTTDSALTTGYCGLRIQLQSNVTARVTNFKAVAV